MRGDSRLDARGRGEKDGRGQASASSKQARQADGPLGVRSSLLPFFFSSFVEGQSEPLQPAVLLAKEKKKKKTPSDGPAVHEKRP